MYFQLTKDSDKQRLFIKEALLILQNEPSLNMQLENFAKVLKLNGGTSHEKNRHGRQAPNYQSVEPNNTLCSLTKSVDKAEDIAIEKMIENKRIEENFSSFRKGRY